MENQKPKQGKTPFIHPSLAGGEAQRGRSRIAPGAQRGTVIQHEKVPEGLRSAVIAPPDFDDSHSAASAEAEPEQQVAADDGNQRRTEVINKLLLFTQPLIKEVSINDMKFRFRMLTPADSAHVGNILNSFPEADQTVLKSRILNLAAALIDIDGVSLESIYTGKLSRDVVLMRYSELLKWSNPILNGVMVAYEKLVDDVKQEYMPDFMKQPKKESTG